MRLSVQRFSAIAVVAVVCGTATAGSPARTIEHPVLGSVVIGTGATDAKADMAKLARFFSSVRESKAETPKCDVLFVYADVAADGSLRNSERDLKAIIRESGAAIVVVASENPPDHYMKLAESEPHKGIFLVMTVERKGRVFRSFYETLFSRMSGGSDILSTWVELVPQDESTPPVIDAPSAMAVSDTGPIKFAKR